MPVELDVPATPEAIVHVLARAEEGFFYIACKQGLVLRPWSMGGWTCGVCARRSVQRLRSDSLVGGLVGARCDPRVGRWEGALRQWRSANSLRGCG